MVEYGGIWWNMVEYGSTMVDNGWNMGGSWWNTYRWNMGGIVVEYSGIW